MKITDLAYAINPDFTFKNIGIRPGEKLHESLISADEARHTKIFDGMYIILPQFFGWERVHKKYEQYLHVPEGFVYTSDKNQQRLSREELSEIIQQMQDSEMNAAPDV
jgi:UDP-N-acetylglucosamine 4,6-dehydratase